MNIDKHQFQRQVQNVGSDEEATNLLRQVIEQHLQWGDDSDLAASIMEIPPVARRLYLVLYMDTGVCGDGFPDFFTEFPFPDLHAEIAHGLALIGATDLQQIFLSAISYLNNLGPLRAAEITFFDMDKETEDIHGRYFEHNRQLSARIGRHTRDNASKIFH
ncbi:MAG: hypothetical protein U0984_09450 [Prosthecobacter sp.]|nr:hypothetical protein [Prosthecobacter sp.]